MILDTTFKHINWPFIGSHNYSNAAAAMLAAYAQLRVIAETNPESKAARILKSATDALTQKLKSRRSVFESPFDPSKTPLALPLEIAHALDDFKGLEHRMEIVGSKNGVTVINNSMCTNPAAVVASVQSIKAQTHILLGGVNKDLDFLPLKNFLGSQRHHVYIFGKDREHMFEMLGQTGTLYETLDQAFKASTLQAKPGTVIMLAPGCASTDQFRDFRHRGDVFRSIAKEWLI